MPSACTGTGTVEKSCAQYHIHAIMCMNTLIYVVNLDVKNISSSQDSSFCFWTCKVKLNLFFSSLVLDYLHLMFPLQVKSVWIMYFKKGKD